MIEQFSHFIKNHHFLVIYGVTWIISVKYYRKYFDTPLRFLPIIIAYTFFTELLGYLIGTSEEYAFFNKLESSNDIIYNIYGLVFFSYFQFIFWKLVDTILHKKVILILWFISFGGFVVNAFFQNPLIQVLFYATSIAALLLAITVLIYWRDKRPEWSWSIDRYNLVTYISIGLFIFHLIFPFIFLTSFLKNELWFTLNLGNIHKSLIVLMYSLFCLGFIISRRRAFR